MEEKSGSKKSFIIIGVIAILLIAAGVITMFVTKDRPTGGDVVPTNEPQTTETTEVTPTPEPTETDVISVPVEDYESAKQSANEAEQKNKELEENAKKAR